MDLKSKDGGGFIILYLQWLQAYYLSGQILKRGTYSDHSSWFLMYSLVSMIFWFSFTISNSNVFPGVVQSFQFVYQQGVLYRLKALGERHNMDITIEGFHSWMWRGLSFLLPFLYLGYIFQLYNAYTLYKLCYHPDATWQVSIYY